MARSSTNKFDSLTALLPSHVKWARISPRCRLEGFSEGSSNIFCVEKQAFYSSLSLSLSEGEKNCIVSTWQFKAPDAIKVRVMPRKMILTSSTR